MLPYSHVAPDASTLLLVRGTADPTELIASGTRGVVDRSATPKRIHAAVRAIDEGLLVL